MLLVVNKKDGNNIDICLIAYCNYCFRTEREFHELFNEAFQTFETQNTKYAAT